LKVVPQSMSVKLTNSNVFSESETKEIEDDLKGLGLGLRYI